MKYLYGIQPTGRIHIGNYLGGIKNALKLQDKHDVTFLIADYHALTKYTRKEVDNMMLEMEEQLHKLGAKKVVFQKPENAELAFELMCLTSFADLKKMTQFKDKGAGNAGLFTYPCLMAADIILSGCKSILVGEDQLQHMELYRKICKKIGKKSAKTILSKTPRIMSIKDPTKKMSKSLGDEHCLYLGDNEANAKKIMKSPTTPEGIKNLKLIARGLGVKYDERNNKQSKQSLIEAINKIT